MIDKQEIYELRAILQAQRNIIANIDQSVSDISVSLNKVDNQSKEISELEKMLDEIELDSDFLSAFDLDNWNDKEIEVLYQEREKKITSEIVTLNYHNWSQFVRDSHAYCLGHNLDASMPWETMLTEENITQIRSENYNNQYLWDKWDYIFVGTAGVLAALTDFLLVGIPKSMTYGGQFQEGSPITSFLKEQINSEKGTESWFANWAHTLEEECKVPYDTVSGGLGGMTGRTHRLQSLGHDPVLGLIFGILDIYRGSITGFSYDKLTSLHTLTSEVSPSQIQTIGLIENFLKQFGHLVSDVGTKMGLPAPLFSLFQGINVQDPISPKSKTVGEVARWMYLNGYDLRHFLTMGLTPAVIEIILRSYLMCRHYAEHGETKFLLAGHPKYRSMLLSAHAIACAGNVGKIALMQGNPLAINYAEWLALLRYLIPSIKYWLFDKSRLKLEYMEKINQEGWQELLDTGKILLQKSYSRNLQIVYLGSQQSISVA
jgi:hypothetical protein